MNSTACPRMTFVTSSIHVVELGIDVVVESGVAENDAAHLRDAFREAGLDANVSDGYIRLSAGDLPPVTFVVEPVKVVLTAIAAGAAAAAGKDVYELLKRVVRASLLRPTRSPTRLPGSALLFQDRTSGFEIFFDGDEPDEAFVELFALDLDEEFAGAGVIAWNRNSQTWEPVRSSSFRLGPGRRRGRRARLDWP
jgi:hypothetical protein